MHAPSGKIVGMMDVFVYVRECYSYPFGDPNSEDSALVFYAYNLLWL